ncbi:MAG: nucleoside monophosphate kinase [Parcubacteria group bacterium]|nr:nucleoside monophosphate kinase [Parcubacteria group bacterium]
MTKGFPIFKTRIKGVNQVFKLEDPVDRQKYFRLKAGREIAKIRGYLKKNTFVGFLLGKKNSGKGTYAKLFMEAIGSARLAHISIGDIVRGVHKDLNDRKRKKDLVEFLRRRYRGPITIESALEIILGRDTKGLLPTEVILALVEREIDKLAGKAVFIDGFPRDLDQISYSLYFRALMGYRDDPDFFVFIDVPESIIDERMKYRVVCPLCQTPRNMRVHATKEVDYDSGAKKFYLLCDNPGCGKKRMTAKEGDELGIEAIRSRIEIDDKVMKTLLNFNGIDKIYLRNSVPVKTAKRYVDDYEITPAYRYEWDKNVSKVRIVEEPWVVKDGAGEKSYSLLPPAVVVSLIRQVAKVLSL